MVQQTDLNLHQPLDKDVEPSIERIHLEPLLATSALVLHGDYYRQLQSLCNRYILWHPVSQAFIIVVLGGYTMYAYQELVEISDSVGEFFRLFKNNKYILTTYFPVVLFLAGVLGASTYMITDEFRGVSDGLATDSYMLRLFRFPLRVYANAEALDLDSKGSVAFLESASKSTDLIKYRGSPIAVVTVIPLPDKSTSEVFYARITGLHVRKVYRSAGLQEELLTYAKEKARDLCGRYVKDSNIRTKNIKIVLLSDAYTIDPVMTQLYARNNFTAVDKTTKIDPFFPDKKVEKLLGFVPTLLLMKFFGIARISYQLELDNTIELLPETKKPARKRK